MTLKPGYNIVTEPVAETETSMSALEFFRHVAADEDIQTPVTVSHLERLLYNAAEEEREAVIDSLRQTLRETESIKSMDAIQFVIDGQLVDDFEFQVRIETAEGGVYLEVGQLFVEEPKVLAPNHAVALK